MSGPESFEAEDEGTFLDDNAVVEPDDDVERASDDPWQPEVLTHLEKLQNSQRSRGQSMLVLVLTMVLFGAAQLVQKSAENLVWLVIVLLIHESGHFAGMKLFGYRDVRMFFLPFFGAAVSGRSQNVPGWKAGIVILLGPLPGIAIGGVLGVLSLVWGKESLRSLSFLFIALNGFNLLPFLPLDGGRLLQLTLFGRQRHLEALFQGTTGLLLALLAFAGGGWVLGVVGLLMLIGSGHVSRISKVAQQALADLAESGKAVGDLEHIPPDVVRQMLPRVRDTFPQVKNAKSAAALIRQVWDRMQVNPPGVAGTLALLAAYAASFVGMLVLGVALAIAGMAPSRVAPPGRDRQLLTQPQLDFADGTITHQGTAFFVRAPNGGTAAVTASHYLDQNGPALTRVWLLSVTAAEPTSLAGSAVAWGLPGGEGVRGANDVTDLRADRFLLPANVDEKLVQVLDLDDRPAGPQPGERVWFPDKRPGEPGGFRLMEGTVTQVETRFVLVELDESLKLQSQSGSPVISQLNGKVLGLLGGGTEESGTTLLFLNPAPEIRRALEIGLRPELSTVVGRSPARDQPAK